ncbi:MAG TPA: hypothetical protein VME92_11605 [Acetobacteraceae bacterium]|nr:hypothetical protein [Acetobacteraceae bacterium]
MAIAADDTSVVARHHGGGRISAILPERLETAGPASLQLLDEQGHPMGAPVVAGLRVNGDYARLRARIDPGLPPGQYAAELHAGDGVRRLTVAVDPLVSLRVDPPLLRLAGAAGAALQAPIMLANAGNVPAELPENGLVGVYEVNGVETAIGHAYRADAEDGNQILARFIEELRKGYGGLVKLRLEGAAGALPPGKARALTITATLPTRLQSGRTYTGVWPFMNLNYAVRVEVGGQAAPANQGQATSG